MWWYLLVAPAVAVLGAVVAVVFVTGVALGLVALLVIPLLGAVEIVMLQLPGWVRGR